MSFWGRAKSLLGSNTPMVALASVAALQINDVDNAYTVTGSTAVTSIVGASFIRNREVVFIGAAGCAVVFTNNNSPGVNQMDLRGSNFTLFAGSTIRLILQIDGTWILSGSTV